MTCLLTHVFVEGEASCLVVRLLSHNSHRFLVLHKQARTVTAKSLEALGLSGCEAEVMTWTAQGKTNAETATILKLSRRTVDKHLEHIYSKSGPASRHGWRLRPSCGRSLPEATISVGSSSKSPHLSAALDDGERRQL